MIYFNDFCTDFMFLVDIVCVTYSFTILSLLIFNFLLVFKISSLLEFKSTGFNYEIYSQITTK